jgi:hypothetical protein
MIQIQTRAAALAKPACRPNSPTVLLQQFLKKVRLFTQRSELSAGYGIFAAMINR